jgi:hypothetical protein
MMPFRFLLYLACGFPGRRGRIAIVGTFLLLLFSPDASVAQDSTRVTVRGRVVDAEIGAPLVGARVLLEGIGGGVLTDESGLFGLTIPSLPRFWLRVNQLGYREKVVAFSGDQTDEVLTIELEVDPVVLEGLDVVVARQGLQVVLERMERRRRGYAGSVRTIPPERFLSSAAAHSFDLIRNSLPTSVPCRTADGEDLCVRRRGQEYVAKVCIDDVRAWGGAGELFHLDPDELFSVEIYDWGRLILVYTRRYMERAMTRRTYVPRSPASVC